MQEFKIKRGFSKNLQGSGLADLMKEVFGNATSKGDGFASSYGAIKEIHAYLKGKDGLVVSTQMDTGASNEVALETRSRYNSFMERATGYNAKERVKSMKKSIEGDDG